MKSSSKNAVRDISRPAVFSDSSVATQTPVWVTTDDTTSFITNNVGADITISAPAGVTAGDLIIVFICTFSHVTTPITPPAGFTLIREEAGAGSFVPGIEAYWKVAGSSEPATYAFSRTGTDTTHVRISCGRVTGYRLVGGTPIDQHAGSNSESSNSTTLTFPSITPTEPLSLAVGGGCFRRGDTSVTGPTEWTDLFASASTFTYDIGFENLVAGATGTRELSEPNAGRVTGLWFNIFGAL